MKKLYQFKVGDIVTYKVQFLRNIQWYTDVPKNGKVVSVRDNLQDPDRQVVVVDWGGDRGEMACQSSWLIPDSKKPFDV